MFLELKFWKKIFYFFLVTHFIPFYRNLCSIDFFSSIKKYLKRKNQISKLLFIKKKKINFFLTTHFTFSSINVVYMILIPSKNIENQKAKCYNQYSVKENKNDFFLCDPFYPFVNTSNLLNVKIST